MRVTKDALVIEEAELCDKITKDGKVHIFNKTKGDIKVIVESLQLYLDKEPTSRTAKKLLKDFSGILEHLKK